MLLEVKNLNAGYGYLQILRDVSLNVDQGEYVCIVGPNGSGKSTTMKTIAVSFKPHRRADPVQWRKYHRTFRKPGG